jgi:hypothetical protein
VGGGEGLGSIRPSLALRRVQDLLLTGSGPELSLDGLNGSVGLDPGGAHVLTTRGEVAIAASAAQPVRFELNVGRGPGELGSEGQVTSVLTDEGQLVPSEWDRRPWFWGPIVGGLVTFAVLAPLTSAVRSATDRLGRFDIGQRLIARGRRREQRASHPSERAVEGVVDEA